MAYTRATGHSFSVHLWDAAGGDITTGTATAEISKDGAAYAAITAPTHIDDELWTVTLTDAQATCDQYDVKVYHASLRGGVLIHSDQAAAVHGVNVTQVAGVAAELDTDIGTNITAILAKFTGITLLAKWLQGLARKNTMDATAKTELNDGGGTYNEATDSQEAIQEKAESVKTDTGTTLPALINLGVTAGTVVDPSPTRLSFVTDLTEATDSHYGNTSGGGVLVFTDGNVKTQSSRILSYAGNDGAGGTITLADELTEAPTNGSAFMILGRIEA